MCIDSKGIFVCKVCVIFCLLNLPEVRMSIEYKLCQLVGMRRGRTNNTPITKGGEIYSTLRVPKGPLLDSEARAAVISQCNQSVLSGCHIGFTAAS